MNSGLKAKWIEALRSGEYKQGYGALRDDDDTFCCLGVLCDVIDPDLWNEDTTPLSSDLGVANSSRRIYLHEFGDVTLYQREINTLFAGDNDIVDGLVQMNDKLQMPFNELASWIETNV